MKGMLFKPDMIKASDEGRKTVTRRLDGLKEINQEPEKWVWNEWQASQMWCRKFDTFWFDHTNLAHEPRRIEIKPRYRVGEIVYIKEAFILENTYEYHEESLAPKDRAYQRFGDDDFGDEHFFLIPHYKSTEPDVLITDGEDEKGRIMTHWQSPLFMPAWAARSFLKILSARPKRLQEMNDKEAILEGVTVIGSPELNELSGGKFIYAYRVLWDSINPKHPFNSNPSCLTINI